MGEDAGRRSLGSGFQEGTAFHFQPVRFIWKLISIFYPFKDYESDPSSAHKRSAVFMVRCAMPSFAIYLQTAANRNASLSVCVLLLTTQTVKADCSFCHSW